MDEFITTGVVVVQSVVLLGTPEEVDTFDEVVTGGVDVTIVSKTVVDVLTLLLTCGVVIIVFDDSTIDVVLTGVEVIGLDVIITGVLEIGVVDVV